jgi:hypothetical protein
MQTTTHRPDRTGPAPRRRTIVLIGGVAAVVLLLPVGLIAALVAVADDQPGPPTREGTPVEPPPVDTAPAGPTDHGEWDTVAQTELATRPMLQLPEAAALPHPLTDQVAGPPIVLPQPADPPEPLPVVFPDSVEGAVAQLAALTRVGLEGGDPQRYRRAYESVSLPGAPAVETARLHRDLRRVRAGVLGFPPTGPIDGLIFTWTPTSALVKGTTDGYRYAVVCVLGELVNGLNGQSISTGAGDCQALRRVGQRWWISPGAAAAPATLAWPGSAEAVRAGYRAVRR